MNSNNNGSQSHRSNRTPRGGSSTSRYDGNSNSNSSGSGSGGVLGVRRKPKLNWHPIVAVPYDLLPDT
jgi:hypothetical protein